MAPLALCAAVARPAAGAFLEAGVVVRPSAPAADLVEGERDGVGVDEAHGGVEQVGCGGDDEGYFAHAGVEEGEDALVAKVFGVGVAQEGGESDDSFGCVARESDG